MSYRNCDEKSGPKQVTEKTEGTKQEPEKHHDLKILLFFLFQNTSHLSSLVSAFHLQKVSPASQTKLDLICSRSVSVPQRLRVMGSLFIIMFVFIITAVLVKVPLEPLPFFSITMVKIIIINSFGAVLQGSLFGMAGLLPASYTTPIMSGQGLAGTFAAASMICAIASGSELEDAAFGYFIVACVVIFLSILSLLAIYNSETFKAGYAFTLL
uniref:Solute carrier family 29 member 1b n=1 Tax=Xiphophorus couchianus TaxID=32473 RepID=A0A3B5LTZ5_9TELE